MDFSSNRSHLQVKKATFRKPCPVAFKEHVSLRKTLFDFGWLFQRDAVGFEISRTGYQTPDQMPG
jgi:hypothetical protein